MKLGYIIILPKKLQSKQWTAKGEPAPKKAKTLFSAGKAMATVFWDSHGIILIDYLQKGKTITGVYYASDVDLCSNYYLESRLPYAMYTNRSR